MLEISLKIRKKLSIFLNPCTKQSNWDEGSGILTIFNLSVESEIPSVRNSMVGKWKILENRFPKSGCPLFFLWLWNWLFCSYFSWGFSVMSVSFAWHCTTMRGITWRIHKASGTRPTWQREQLARQRRPLLCLNPTSERWPSKSPVKPSSFSILVNYMLFIYLFGLFD